MIGNLATAIENLLTASMPTLIGEAEGQVTVAVSRPEYVVDPSSADALAGAPRPDNRRDVLPFNPDEAPEGPHLLSQPPYPGPRRVYLENSEGERITLSNDEVVWDQSNPQQFTLQLKAHRDTTGLDQMTVLYGITGIFTSIKAANSVEVELTSTNSANLLAAEALAVSIMQLNRETLRENAEASISEGDYSVSTTIKKLIISQGATLADDRVVITLDAESEVKASRALQEDEGVAIERIASPGTTPDPDRPVHIDPLVEA
jgi:hypothetical protein